MPGANPLTSTQAPGEVITLVTPDGERQFIVQDVLAYLGYVAGNLASWPLVPPATLLEAADVLANTNRVNVLANTGAIGPSASPTFSAPITPVKSGRYLVVATASAAFGVLNTATLSVFVDSGPVIAAQTWTGEGGRTSNAFVLALAAVARGSAHTWSVRVHASTGNATIAPGNAQLALVEL